MEFTKNDLQDLAVFEAAEYIKAYGEEDFDNIVVCIGGSIKTLKDLQDHGIADGLTEEECWNRLKQIRNS
jgi:hypothetical protein